jgi:hypothetical protein
MSSFVLIGNPENRRTALFQAALAGLGLPPATLLPWIEVVTGKIRLADHLKADTILRIDSCGKNFEVEKRLLWRGGGIKDDPYYEKIGGLASEELAFDKGRIWPSRQWYLGWRAVLQHLEAQRQAAPPHRVMQHIPDLITMFDKVATHARLKSQGFPVPTALLDSVGQPLQGFGALLAAMRKARLGQVFIKPAHSSSASGVIAYRRTGDRHQAITTIEIYPPSAPCRLYNSRHIRTYQGEPSYYIQWMIEQILRQRAQVECWIPKATLGDHSFDLRVVVIGGEVRHIVPRLSQSPITNLHLLNERGTAQDVIALVGDPKWQAIRQLCQEMARQCFPDSLHLGIDLLLSSRSYKPYFLEVNAFGDLLPDVLDRGEDTYTAEIKAVLG